MILTINSGSSNVKFAIFDAKEVKQLYASKVSSIKDVVDFLNSQKSKYNITAIGHRIVHGGTKFFEPILISKKILEELKLLVPLAPLHQTNNIAAIDILNTLLPQIPQVACFDTAYHVTQQPLAKLFAIPNSLTNSGIIRYGFHGLSYEYIASTMEKTIGLIANKKVIVAHLGNGSSMCAMYNKLSVATSMGFSALDGLMMGSRCGSIDPGVLLYLLQEKNYSPDSLSDLLYSKSGLLGVSGLSNDIRVLLSSTDINAKTAIDLYCYKVACEFGSLIASGAGCDALVFTAGIGENSAAIRENICDRLKCFGFEISTNSNQLNQNIISSNNSKIIAAVIPTNEEYMLAKHTIKVVYTNHQSLNT